MNWDEIWNNVLDFLTTSGWNILISIIIIAVGILVVKVVKKIFTRILNKSKLNNLFKKYLIKIIVFALVLGIIVLVLMQFGVQFSGIVAVIAACGLAFALALQDMLSSLANGVVILVTKPFQENDWVSINGEIGKVVAIKFFNTILENLDNERIIIPNKHMVNYTIVNSTFHGKRRFRFRFKVSHNTDVTKLSEIVKSAMLSNPNVFTKPEPCLLCQEITENGVIYEARGWCVSEMPQFEIVSTDVLQTLYNELKRNGVELATKNIVVYNEERQKPFVDETPLNNRDMTVDPKMRKIDNRDFEDYFEYRKIKINRNKKENKKTKNKK